MNGVLVFRVAARLQATAIPPTAAARLRSEGCSNFACALCGTVIAVMMFIDRRFTSSGQNPTWSGPAGQSIGAFQAAALKSDCTF